jgi:thiamine biosynthesis lipoprotein
MSIQTTSDPAAGQELELTLELFGTRVRLLAGGPSEGGSPPEAALAEVEAMLREMHDRLTRFDPDSELSGLNSSPTETVAGSSYLTVAVEAAVEAAVRSGGLVDPVMIEALGDVGYSESKAGAEPVPLADALASISDGDRKPASPRSDSPWQKISVDLEAGQVTRPVGVRIDLGGIGKGLAADLAATHLEGFASWCADIGGDLRLGGTAGLDREVGITHPLSGEVEIRFSLNQGAVATSGISRRVWRGSGAQGYAHHLLDPSTGLPAWTGVIQASAVAGSAREAETLSKVALLSGPERGAEVLSAGAGGVMVLDSGEVKACGPLAERLVKGSASSMAKVAVER